MYKHRVGQDLFWRCQSIRWGRISFEGAKAKSGAGSLLMAGSPIKESCLQLDDVGNFNGFLPKLINDAENQWIFDYFKFSQIRQISKITWKGHDRKSQNDWFMIGSNSRKDETAKLDSEQQISWNIWQRKYSGYERQVSGYCGTIIMIMSKFLSTFEVWFLSWLTLCPNSIVSTLT